MKKNAHNNENGLEGLNIILNDASLPPESPLNSSKETNSSGGYRLLIEGRPGTGKTTLGLHLIHNQIICKKGNDRTKGLVIYYQEQIGKLDFVANKYGLSFKENIPARMQITIDEFEKGLPSVREWIRSNKDAEKLCILIDGLSILKSEEPKKIHKYLSLLMTDIIPNNLFLIIIGEEGISGDDYAFEHMVDGVIKLKLEEQTKQRYLEITKLRYIDYFKGIHGFELHRINDAKSELKIYPSPACLFWYLKLNKMKGKDCVNVYYESGINGLKELINSDKSKNQEDEKTQLPFKSGDVFIVTAEPGTDKFGLGLSFLRPIVKNDNFNEKGLWVSFSPSTLKKISNNEFYRNNFHDIFKHYRSYEESINKSKKYLGPVEKSLFPNKKLVLTLLNENLIIEDEVNKDYVYFNKTITTEKKLKKRLQQIGINENERMSTLWEGSQSPLLSEICSISGTFHPFRMLYDVYNFLESNSNKMTRIVIDSLPDFPSDSVFTLQKLEYTMWLVRLLNHFNTISIVFIDLPRAFQPIGDIPMEWKTEATYVGHLRWFEINNQLTATFVLTKSRFRHLFKSIPQYIAYDKIEKTNKDDTKSEMILEDRGWPMINMLSGKMSTIQEAKVFLKFFDQNYSTREVHESIFNEFKERYARDQIFAHVYRGTPSPKHWSFRGYAGAGHSNTKVVCLKQYIMDVLEKDGVLLNITQEYELGKYSERISSKKPKDEYVEKKAYSLWSFACRENNKESKTARKSDCVIPLFADIGVLCGQTDKKALIAKAKHESAIMTNSANTQGLFVEEQDIYFPTAPKTWDEFFEENEIFQKKKKEQAKRIINNDPLIYPQWIDTFFAMPDLTSDFSGFISFFFEILLDHYDSTNPGIENRIKLLKSKNGLRKLIEADAFKSTVNLLRKFVLTGATNNPLESTHYHTSFFSRRWFSKIDQYPFNDPRLPEIEKYRTPKWDRKSKEEEDLKMRFDFSAHPLPTSNPNKNTGISCLEFYSLGLIKGALAPETAWMFISELASTRPDIMRFGKRRGLPILRENWFIPRQNPQRKSDAKVIDEIIELKSERFFCNFWIDGYWNIEKNLQKSIREIFISVNTIDPKNNNYDDSINNELSNIKPNIEDLRTMFLTDIDSASKEITQKSVPKKK